MYHEPKVNDRNQAERKIRIRGMAGGIVPVIFMAVILFAASGRLDWTMAWALLGIHFAGSAYVTLSASPSLIEERTRRNPGTRGWDKTLLPLMSVTGLVALLVAGLDMRFGWSLQFPFALEVAAAILLVLGYAILDWAAITNKFFSATVRIQQDRGHTTVTGGPYRFIRHPGYLGLIICVLAQPLMLGSLWALVPAIVTAFILLARTGLEDRSLRKELPGYAEYSRQVRRRLLPGVW
jgi:protein-S-isoprenylcysteine O-methyltransferase Ste14